MRKLVENLTHIKKKKKNSYKLIGLDLISKNLQTKRINGNHLVHLKRDWYE